MLPTAARALKRHRSLSAAATSTPTHEALVCFVGKEEREEGKEGFGQDKCGAARHGVPGLSFPHLAPPPPPLLHAGSTPCPTPWCTRNASPQRFALDQAALVRASADAAYLERDPAARPPPAAFVAYYAKAALAALDGALHAARDDDRVSAVDRADAMLARDRLAAELRRSGESGEWPE